MTQTFPLRPTPVDRETFPSFLSRLAAMRITPTIDFALHMGSSLSKVAESNAEALVELSKWGGLSDLQFEEMQSWTGISVGDIKMRFRGEDHSSRTLRSPHVRGCPICLREDQEGKKGPPSQNMAMRGHWQLKSVTSCLRHSHPLIVLWSAHSLMARYDYQARIEEIAPQILSGALDQDLCEINEFDLWLDERLQTGHDETWLADQPLYASLIFSKLLGQELLRRNDIPATTGVTPDSIANNKAFAIMRDGEAAIKAALMALSDATQDISRGKNFTYDTLYKTFNELYCTNPAFSTYQRLFRDILLEVWDFDDGEVVLGEPLERRKLHSVTSAASKAGVAPHLIEAYLIHAGALQQDDTRPFNRKTFDALRYADVIEKAPRLKVLRDVREGLRATKNEVQKLVTEGHILPRTSDEKIRKKWCLDEAMELLGLLEKNAIPLSVSDGWETLLLSSNRIQLPLSFLFDLIQREELTVGTIAPGFSGLVVKKSEVDQLRYNEPQTHYI